MRFREPEIELAVRLKAAGLAWSPVIGDHFFDAGGNFSRGTLPFDRLHVIEDLGQLVLQAGSLDAVIRETVWLPSYDQARTLVENYGVAECDIEDRLLARLALTSGDDLLVLYELLEEQLQRANAAALRGSEEASSTMLRSPSA